MNNNEQNMNDEYLNNLIKKRNRVAELLAHLNKVVSSLQEDMNNMNNELHQKCAHVWIVDSSYCSENTVRVCKICNSVRH